MAISMKKNATQPFTAKSTSFQRDPIYRLGSTKCSPCSPHLRVHENNELLQNVEGASSFLKIFVGRFSWCKFQWVEVGVQ